MIKLTRDTGWTDRLRAYSVVVGGTTLGAIKRGENKDFPIAPGTHEMIIKVDWCSGNSIIFEVKEGETVSFSCGSSLRGIKVFLAIVYITFLRNKYLWLKQR